MADEKETPAFEVVEAEQVSPYYFKEGLIRPDYDLYRLNLPKSGRVYFRFADRANQLEPIFYGGVTSVNDEIPKGEFLMKWIADKGWSESRRYTFLRMLYGSFSHSRLSDLVMLGNIDLNILPAMLRKYFYDQSFYVTEQELKDLGKEIQKDMISMQQWIIDHEVEFVFSEYPVYSDIDGLATQIDIGAFVTVDEKVDDFKKDGTLKKYKKKVPQRVFALINYKSGKGAFTEEHRYQLESEKNLFIECYPTFTTTPIRVFNLAPTDWKVSTNWGEEGRASPYKFSDFTEDIDYDRYNAYIALTKNTRNKRLSKKITFIEGEMKVGDNPQNFIITKTLEDIVREGTWKRFVKTSAGIPQ